MQEESLFSFVFLFFWEEAAKMLKMSFFKPLSLAPALFTVAKNVTEMHNPIPVISFTNDPPSRFKGKAVPSIGRKKAPAPKRRCQVIGKYRSYSPQAQLILPGLGSLIMIL